MTNLILMTDSYKTSHYKQYPPNTEHVFSYVESRGGRFDKVLFFGLQILIKRYLTQAITQADIDQAEQVIQAHGLPFNRAGWEHILHQHQGYLPVRIKAVAEGSCVPVRNALLTIENTDPECFWLTSYLETLLVQNIWYPTTVASLSNSIKENFLAYHEKSSDLDPSTVDFKLHDFGFRGVSSCESAAIGGLAHLVNFPSTDTMVALLYGQQYYNCPMAGFSIPAAEHSTITSWGRKNEQDAFANMLTQFAKPGALVAVVSDSYDIYHAIDQLWGKKLKQQVLDSGATVSVRPDSGDPAAMSIQAIEMLMKHYGYSINSKGYKVLPDCIRVIQGDGISQKSLKTIIANLDEARLSLDNITFGMGGALLQKLHRDTLKFAMKCSAIFRNGQWQEVYKNPITDPQKASKPGRLALIYNENNEYQTIGLDQLGDRENCLKTVYEDGQLLIDQSLQDIRERIQKQQLFSHLHNQKAQSAV